MPEDIKTDQKSEVSAAPVKRKRGAPKGSGIGNKNAVGNAGGRPTLFKAEYAQALKKFFDIISYKKEVMEKSKHYYKDGELKSESEKYKMIPAKLPTLFGFARSIGVEYWTVNNWMEKGLMIDEKTKEPIHPEYFEFSKSYKEAKEQQKEFLISLGLSGAAPAPAFIFVAKNVTDMRDKTETDLTSKGEAMGIIYLPAKPKE